jgi:hypothetical protein
MVRIARLLCVLAVVSLSTSVMATPLNLTQAFPDFSAITQVDTEYDASQDIFSVTGFISQYSDPTSHLATGAFTLDAVIDDTGALTSGTLTINGIVLDGIAPPPAADLLIVDLTDFGFSGTGASTIFEFIGDTTGGSMAGLFDNGVGVILNPGTTDYAGLFTSDFVGSSGTVDAFYVPEPATMILLLGGLSALAVRRKR